MAPSTRNQLLNQVVDELAEARPEAVWAKVPRSDAQYGPGYRKITNRALANAVNSIARWIQEQLGSSSSLETLAYFGVWDPRYTILLLGAVKAGYKMLFPSPTSTYEAAVSLLRHVGCRAVLAASTESRLVAGLSQHWPTLQIPSLNVLLDMEPVDFPYQKTFEDARAEPLLVISPGSADAASSPALRYWTHEWVAALIDQNQLTPPEGYVSFERLAHGIEFCALGPPHDTANLLPNILALANQSVILYPLPNSLISAEAAIAMVQHNDPSMLIAPPHVLSGILADRAALELIVSKVSMVGYGRGPLPLPIGEQLSRSFRVFCMYGTTEMGLLHKIAPAAGAKRGSWNSMMPHPRENIEFRHYRDNLFHAVIVRSHGLEATQPIFKLFPELDEWPTKDLFSLDPSQDGFWIYQRRLDQTLILANGDKIDPVSYEEQISSAPCVTQTLMGGWGKSRPALVVQLASSTQEKEEVYALVESCNQNSPPQASISRSHVIFASDTKPLPPLAQGLLAREQALKLYEPEINALYD